MNNKRNVCGDIAETHENNDILTSENVKNSVLGCVFVFQLH